MAALRGDPRAFAALVSVHRGRATAVATRMLGSRDEAEDVVQEALLRSYLSLSQLREPTRFATWLCGIAVNLAKMRLRQRVTQARALRAAAATNGDAPDALEERAVLQVVREAVELLPATQREAVLMHYVDDLSCDEIASLLGSSAGAVRVRLHRARSQLREELAAFAPVTAERVRREARMLEMRVEDVLVRVSDEGPSEPVARQRIILLKEAGGDRVLPIWVGPPEGDALALKLHDEPTPRPMTSDLMASLIRIMGARVERVTISSLREKTFYALIGVAVDDRVEEVDARPSDALNLAVRVGAPIFAAAGVVDEAASSPDDLPEKLEREAAQGGDELPPGRWASLSGEMLRPLYEPPRPKEK